METLKFETVKTAVRQSKDGYILSLVVHPDDVPEDLLKHPIGSRYIAVLVRIGDNEEPIVEELENPYSHAIKMAGILCRDGEFTIFAEETLQKYPEDTIEDWLRSYLNIKSRKEFRTNVLALEGFTKLRTQFDNWKKIP